MSEPLQIEDSLIYRLTDHDGVNCEEINVTMWLGSRSAQPRTAGARRVLACLNACETVPIDWLESGTPGCVQNVRDERDQYKRRSEDLLAAVKSLSDWHGDDRFNELIANAEQKP